MKAAAQITQTNFNNKRLIFELIQRDLKLRYLGSFFGKYWNIINPMIMITIYTVIFSQIMQMKVYGSAQVEISYPAYLCSGLLPWIAFTEVLTRGSGIFLDNAHLIKKLAFPFEVLPTTVIGSTAFTFAISWLTFTFILPLLGVSYSPYLLLVPVIFVLQMTFAFGISLFLAVFNVFFRDIQQIVNIAVQLWFWLTPIVYLKEKVPEAFTWVVAINPIAYFIQMYHSVTIYKTLPAASDFLLASSLAIGTFVLGSWALYYFRDQIPDEV